MIDVRGFNGGMNQDASPELLPKNDYTYAMNIGNGSEGITNLLGNRLPTGFPPNINPGGEWVCGAFFDKVRQRIIYFTNHERGTHRIISYLVPSIGNENGSYVVLFEDFNGVFSYWDVSPQYEPNLLIKDIKVIHRDFEGDLYYFVDPKKKLLKFNYNTILTYKTSNNALCAFGWTSANYDGTKLNDGTDIPQVTDTAAWATLTTPAWCYYNNDANNNSIYGKLYNWYAVSHPLFAPIGYRVPTDTDWDNLVTCLGGSAVAGGKLKSTTGLWSTPNTGATNESLFNAVPGGFIDDISGFNFIGIRGSWWSATEDNANNAFSRTVLNDTSSVTRASLSKKIGFSVRLIKQ